MGDDRDRRLRLPLYQVHELTDAEKRGQLGARKRKMADRHALARGAPRLAGGQPAEDLLRELENWPRAAIRNGEPTELRVARPEFRERCFESRKARRRLLCFVSRQGDAALRALQATEHAQFEQRKILRLVQHQVRGWILRQLLPPRQNGQEYRQIFDV